MTRRNWQKSINYPIHTHILIRNIEPHIYETTAYALGLQQYPVTNGSLSHITALSTIVGVQLNLVTTGAELETHQRASLIIFDFSMYKRISPRVNIRYIQKCYAYRNGP